MESKKQLVQVVYFFENGDKSGKMHQEIFLEESKLNKFLEIYKSTIEVFDIKEEHRELPAYL